MGEVVCTATAKEYRVQSRL